MCIGSPHSTENAHPSDVDSRGRGRGAVRMGAHNKSMTFHFFLIFKRQSTNKHTLSLEHRASSLRRCDDAGMSSNAKGRPPRAVRDGAAVAVATEIRRIAAARDMAVVLVWE